MAAELADEEELPPRGPAEAPGNRPAQAARPTALYF